MTANPIIDPAQFLSEHLERAEPDYDRSRSRELKDSPPSQATRCPLPGSR